LVRPNETLKELQEKFVRLRIVDMSDVDVALFEFDFDLTFSLFVLNHEKHLYLRYGARDDRSAESYLSEKSLVRALEKGLTLHEDWKKGAATFPRLPKPVPVKSYPRLREIIEKGQCVHCHQVADSQSQALIALPEFNKKTDPWPYPNPKTLGLIIDPDKGNALSGTEGPAATVGLKSGDTVVGVDDRPVHTFADLQYALHKVSKNAKSVPIQVEGKENRSVQLPLPEFWRVTDINRRSIGHRMTPFPGFWGKTLDAEHKKRLGLKPDGFATEVTKFWTNTRGKKAGLQMGDVVYAINGTEMSPIALNVMIYIRTHFKQGDEIKVGYRHGSEERETSFKLKEKPW